MNIRDFGQLAKCIGGVFLCILMTVGCIAAMQFSQSSPLLEEYHIVQFAICLYGLGLCVVSFIAGGVLIGTYFDEL